MPPSDDPLPSTTGLSESDRHLLLSAERRRIALSVLAGRDSPMNLEALATAVAAREHGEEAAEEAAETVAEDGVDRTMIDLHHCHLPRLDDLGVIDYDPDARRVG